MGNTTPVSSVPTMRSYSAPAPTLGKQQAGSVASDDGSEPDDHDGVWDEVFGFYSPPEVVSWTPDWDPYYSAGYGSGYNKPQARPSKGSELANSGCWAPAAYKPFYDDPFDVQYPRVVGLCRQLWPSAKLDVGALSEGSYNRVVWVDLVEEHPDGAATAAAAAGASTTRFSYSHYILRMARYDSMVETSVAMLRLLEERYPRVSAPRVVFFDTTANNPLGYPYIVETRIPGQNLCRAIDKLTHKQHVQLAREMGQLYQLLQSCTSDLAGEVVEYASDLDDDADKTTTGDDGAPAKENTAANGDHAAAAPAAAAAGKPRLRIAPFGSLVHHRFQKDMDPSRADESALPASLHNKEPPGLGAMDILCNAHKRRREQVRCHEALAGVPSNAEQSYLLLAMTQWLFVHGSVHADDQAVCLWHADLYPRNIMVNRYAGPGEPLITGIIDWDDVMFMPRFLTCVPPLWLWLPSFSNGVPDSDQTYSNVTGLAADAPPKLLEVKAAFDEAAGDSFTRCAYSDVFVWARVVARFGRVTYWDWSRSQVQLYHDTLREWNRITDKWHLNNDVDVEAILAAAAAAEEKTAQHAESNDKSPRNWPYDVCDARHRITNGSYKNNDVAVKATLAAAAAAEDKTAQHAESNDKIPRNWPYDVCDARRRITDGSYKNNDLAVKAILRAVAAAEEKKTQQAESND